MSCDFGTKSTVRMQEVTFRHMRLVGINTLTKRDIFIACWPGMWVQRILISTRDSLFAIFLVRVVRVIFAAPHSDWGISILHWIKGESIQTRRRGSECVEKTCDVPSPICFISLYDISDWHKSRIRTYRPVVSQIVNIARRMRPSENCC